jgi:peptidyl-prolyl cis-trans isomerase D
MLNFMRSKVSGVLGILLIGLLVFAFGLWGVADTFTGFSNEEIAQVGDQKIDRQEYQLRYLQRTQSLSQQLGTSLSPAMARNLGVEGQVLNNMLGSAALREAAEELGLGRSDTAIAAAIVKDPSFLGVNGQFDEPTFRSVLQQNGLTEKLFVEDQRRFHMLEQLSSATVDSGLVPKVLTEKLYKHFLERRVARYLILTLKETDDIGDPTNEELETFFSQTKLRFAEPEKRSGQALVVSPARFAELISIDAATLEEEYEASIDEYSVAETRAIDQLVVSEDEEVAKVKALLSEGASFAKIVLAVGQTLSNTDLGTVEREDLISADLAEKSFAMKKGEISDVIEGPLGYVVLRVRDITPGTTKPLSEVAELLRNRIIYDRALDDMLAFSETVEDELASGETLESVGQRFDLNVISIRNINADGENAKGRKMALLSRYDNIAPSLFETAVGEETPMIEMDDGTYVWLRLTAITPSEVPPLADIRKTVSQQWEVAEQTKLLEAMAEHMVKQGNETGSFKSVAASFKRDPLVSEPMTRQVSNDTFSDQAVKQLFAVPNRKFAWANVGFGGEIIVMQVSKVIPADVRDGEAKDLIFDGEKRKYHLDLTNQFVRSLQGHFGLSVNQANLERATSELVSR